MRIHLSSEDEELTENNSRVSHANFGSRKNYAMLTVMLQKWLMFDNSLMTIKYNACTLTDSQSYYDR